MQERIRRVCMDLMLGRIFLMAWYFVRSLRLHASATISDQTGRKTSPFRRHKRQKKYNTLTDYCFVVGLLSLLIFLLVCLFLVRRKVVRDWIWIVNRIYQQKFLQNIYKWPAVEHWNPTWRRSRRPWRLLHVWGTFLHKLWKDTINQKPKSGKARYVPFYRSEGCIDNRGEPFTNLTY